MCLGIFKYPHQYLSKLRFAEISRGMFAGKLLPSTTLENVWKNKTRNIHFCGFLNIFILPFKRLINNIMTQFG